MAYVAVASISCPRVLAGDTRAIARLLTRAEAGIDEARPALDAMFRARGPRARRRHHRRAGQRQVDAGREARARRSGAADAGSASSPIDPSSPFSGGAILGDRIRMGELGGDPGVFVRSMATRGALGGLARGTLEAVDVLDAAGFDMVVIETVGVGQDEVEVARAAHTTVVVSAPGLGDDIQAIKAGHPRDRRHPRRQQVRPAGREPDDRRPQDDAGARARDRHGEIGRRLAASPVVRRR